MGKVQHRIDPAECVFIPIRSSGPGGQHADKAATGIQLRFDINASSLPENIKKRLSKIADGRISSDGVVVIQATNSRSQEKNKTDAMDRLQELVDQAAVKPKKRKKTKPPKKAKEKRLEKKARRSAIKQARKKPKRDD